MSRLTDHLAGLDELGVEADPLPESKVQGDSADTEAWDHDDAPPGIDRKTGKDHRSPEAIAAWDQLVETWGDPDSIPYPDLAAWEARYRP